MLNNVINRLIPSGIINHLIENFYTKKIKIKKIEEEPKVLSLDDLTFGFNIYIASCLTSFLGFLAEKVFILRSKKIKRKTKVSKIHLKNNLRIKLQNER